MYKIKKILQLLFQESRPWLYFIIWCLFCSALLNQNYDGNYSDKVLADAVGLYFFGSISWIILNELMKTRNEKRVEFEKEIKNV